MTSDQKKFKALEDAFVRRFGESVRGVSDLAMQYMAAGMKPYDALDKAMKDKGAYLGIDAAITEYATGSLYIGWPTGLTERTREASAWLLKTSYAGQKRPLIKTLKDKTYMDGVKSMITSQIERGTAWNKATTELVRASVLQRPNLPQYLQRAVDAAKRANPYNPLAVAEYKAEVAKAMKQVDQLAKNGATTEFLKKAYSNVLTKIEQGKLESLSKAIDRAVTAKVKYEAQRIARTEGFAAYGQSKVEEAMTDEDISALRFTLNSRHHDFDKCDIIANSDLYGLGAGVYPKDKAPRLPIHPNGMSYYSPVSIRKVSQEESQGASFDKGKWDREVKRRGLSPSASNPPAVTQPLIPKEVNA